MPEYFFVLGRDPNLAAAELVSYLAVRDISYEISLVHKNIALVRAHDINLTKAVADLGGTVKAGLVIARVPASADDQTKTLDNYPFWTDSGNKLNWTVSTFDGNKKTENLLKSYFKKRFKDEKLKAMWKSEPRPWELVAWKAGLEIVSFSHEKETYIGKTVAVSDLRSVQRRDLGRPAQKPEIAISIRLARILINLSGAKPGTRLLDPFCGIGTILQEALLKGIESIGIDIDAENVAAAKRNIEWFTDNYGVNTRWTAGLGNATELHEIFDKETISAIATEPYLGPLLKSAPTEAQAKKIISELSLLYKNFLIAAHAVLAPGGRMAIIFPRFTVKKRAIEVQIDQMAKDAGFELWQPTEMKIFPYLYTSEQKKLDRLIYVLVKQ